MTNKTKYIWGLLRILMGWMFLWAFIDKLFGLGFSTASAKAWINGVSPTFGFLKFATKGPLASFYQGLAGSPFVEWLFMIGLLFIGIALLFGVFVKIASYSGIIMLFLIYISAFPPEHNPFLDKHIIYGFLMAGFIISNAGQALGFGKWWSKQEIVKKYSILE